MIGRVLLIGDELLGGTISDTNGQTIARALSDVGVVIDRVEITADDPGAIATALRRLSVDADLVVVTGGLGPTADDVTRDGVAELLGAPLEEDPDALSQLRARLEARGLDDPDDLVLRQAWFPRGATRVGNPVGSAPGFRVEHGKCQIWVLPGVPHEAGAMIDQVADSVGTSGVSWQRIIATVGPGEVRVAERIRGFEPPEGSRLAFLPHAGGVRLRIVAPGGLPAATLDAAEAELRAALGSWALPGPSIEASVVAAAAERGWHLASAESCTGGLIGARITDVPGSSSVYLGGIVAYADRTKVERLGVDAAELERHGAVSEPVVRAMAEGARVAFEASLAVAVTGVAGPGGGSPEKPVGTVWIGVASGGGCLARSFLFPGERALVRERTVNKALEMTYRRMVEDGA